LSGTARKRHLVAIIGAGFSGLIVAIGLRRAGIDDFVLYEREDDFGGTWYVNRYPGCAVDSGSATYRLSCLPYHWSRSHAAAPEVLGYLRHAAEKFDIAWQVKCNCAVKSVRWDDRRKLHEITLADGEVEEADVVVSAIGLLSEPSYPDWPGLELFRGRLLHTAKWDTSLDYAGKRVAVVGTGSTSVQLVPELAKQAAHVTVFQRQPGWIFPKEVVEFNRAAGPVSSQQEADALDAHRKEAMADVAKRFADGRVSQTGSVENRQAQAVAENFIRESFADRPDLIPLVTPDYPVMGKRPVFSSDFYPALKRDNVTLVPHAVQALTAGGIVDATGREHPADIVAMATGFTASRFLRSVEVRGANGISLQDFWGDEPRAYIGVMVPKFPNFFIMYGPNTNSTGALITMFEAEAAFAVDSVRDMLRGGHATVEVDEARFEEYNRWLDDNFANSAFNSTRNYFTNKRGRIITNYPRGSEIFLKMLREGRESALIYGGARADAGSTAQRVAATELR
jgi:cation diffusion facilitator CzcD-associated flavoprotein CzcO